MTPRLQVTGIGKSFAGVKALDAITFDIAPGAAIGVLGPNGCGRTVLLDILSGLLPPDHGNAHFTDEAGTRSSLAGLPPQDIVELGIARTWQDLRLIGGIAVLDEVVLGAYSRRRTGLFSAALGLPAGKQDMARAYDRARQMLTVVGLGGRASSLADQLSRSEQMRVGMARALTAEPELLLLDAPAAGLGDAERANLAELIGVLCESGISVLVADRSINLIARCCVQAIALDAGRVVATGSPTECFASAAVQQAYFGTGLRAEC